LAFASANVRNDFFWDLGVAQIDSRHGIVSSRADANDRTWDVWRQFCHDLAVDPTLQTNVCDPIHLLQVFAHRYRSGAIAPSGRRVKSRTVEGAFRAVGQTLAGMGAPDPRLAPNGRHEFRLGRQFASYDKTDDPPTRVKPIPLQVIEHAVAIAHAAPTPDGLAAASMMLLGFFFLMRPGEHTITTGGCPFELEDALFQVGNQSYKATLIPLELLDSATFVTLTFKTQKNAVRGEAVGLGKSGRGQICPVQAAVNRVRDLRTHSASPTTHLGTYYPPTGRPKTVTSAQITTMTMLRFALAQFGPTLGVTAADISARSLRASGAMALLCAHIDHDTIRLIGRWRSDEMLRYLNIQAQPVMADFSRRMIHGGHYSMLPNINMTTPLAV
jgi:hypothetical protein